MLEGENIDVQFKNDLLMAAYSVIFFHSSLDN
jgi:hypothetical protein